MKIRKVFAVALIAAICLSLYFVYAPASAEDLALTAQDGLCVHHPEHTAECGYYLETGENTCSHVHDDICGYVAPVDAQPCNHTHDASCGYVEARAEVPCDQGCTDTDGDGTIDHVEDCAYQPAVEGQPCTHVHDETCGYAEAVEGQACTHVHDETCGYVDPSQTGVCVYAQAGCPYCVVDWQWSDPQGFLTQEADGSWSMDMPGVSASNPVSASALQSFLPTEIATRMDNDTMPALAIAWDLTAIPADGATSGDYLLQAYLADPTYALTDAAAPLQVTLRLGGTETLIEQIPTGDPPYQDYIVTGVSPSGTTIDLFDYWVTGQFDSDISDPDYRIDKGINANHALMFIATNKSTEQGAWNCYYADVKLRPGMVKDKLENGYPTLSLDMSTAHDSNFNYRDGNESLAYLFDPRLDCQGKESFSDVKGLLQIDENGYYYYNSATNYAVYYENANAFTLYKYPGVKPGGKSPVGQFFPFNEANAAGESYQHSNGESYYLMNTNQSNDAAMNHYFGLHMSTRFIQQDGGYTSADQETPVTYEFSGDDDVWIFIDGTLVADLGGIHDAASVKIDFSTGDITINGVVQTNRLGAIFGYSGNTLPDNTYHTLDFFYLERGNTDSNMYLKYNLVTIPESSVIKVDQVGDPVPGAEFSLYAADDYDRNEPIATRTTNNNGEFVFVKKETTGERPITIQELYDTYKNSEDLQGNNLILKETHVPEGYRSNGEIGLYFNDDNPKEVLLLSNSTWDKGAYAMPKVTTTIDTAPLIKNEYSGDFPQSDGNVSNGILTPDPQYEPLMFAVVYQKQKDGTTWLPVSGDPLNGWTVHEDNSWQSVLAAAKDNPYIFQLASSGEYQVEVSNLPGDITKYYHICGSLSTAQYTIGYYFTTADTLDRAEANNTWRIDTDNEQLPVDRVFSVNLYVSNIKNRLLVQKVNEDGEVITTPGFVFSLYKKDQVTLDEHGNVVGTEGVPYDQVTTSATTSITNFNGGGIFPTAGKVLANGEYYLVETDAPYGYKKSEKATHIVVDHTGVYADAGEKDDGIEVLRGVGSIIHSMAQFAADDDVDTTLHDIKAALAVGDTIEGINTDGIWSTNNVLHLRYANENALLDYGLYDGTPGTLDNLSLSTDVGWSKLLIQQCYNHEGILPSDLKTNLGNQDITNLFSGTVTVRVTNERVGNLMISKKVTAEEGQTVPSNARFTFTVTCQKDDNPVSGTFKTLNQNNEEGTIIFTNGKATLPLGDQESLIILGLPYGAYYSVTEEAVPGYNVSVQKNEDASVQGVSANGNIHHSVSDADAEKVAFTNLYDGEVRVSLIGVKTLQGRSLVESDNFVFTLEPYGLETTVAVNDGRIVLPNSLEAEVSSAARSTSAQFSFGMITFKDNPTETKTYTFAIQEQLPLGATEGNGYVSGGIRYDHHIAIASVTITYNESAKKWEASVTYENEDAVTEEDQAVIDKAAFTNVGAYDLTIAKKVTGEMGDRDKPFTFQISVPGMENQTLSYTGGTWEGAPADVQPPSGDSLALNEKGEATFTLSHGQTITIHGLPVGTTYTITEPDAQADGYTVTASGADAKMSRDASCSGTLNQETTVTFTNQKATAVPTGLRLDALPWLLALLCGLAGCTVLCVTGKRHRRKGGCGGTHG